MIDAINHLKMAAEDYRRLTTPNQFTITEAAARENERLANQFDMAAEALRQMHNRLFEEGIVAGVKSLVDSCNARRQRKASPASAPEGFKHDIGADRFTVVQGSYWWHVRAGEGTQNIGKFHTKRAAEEMALTLLTAFRDGAFMQYQAMLAAAPTPPVSEDRKDAERYRWLISGKRRSWIWDCVLTEEERTTGNFLEEIIDAAMQEDKS